MVKIVKASFYVRVQYPFVFSIHTTKYICPGILCTSCGSKTIALRTKGGFPKWFYCGFDNKLHDTVFYHQNPQGSLFAIRFWYVHSPDWLRLISFPPFLGHFHQFPSESSPRFRSQKFFSIYPGRLFALIILRDSPDTK